MYEETIKSMQYFIDFYPWHDWIYNCLYIFNQYGILFFAFVGIKLGIGFIKTACE